MIFTTPPAGVSPHVWARFIHGLPVTVPVLLLEHGDAIYIPDQNAERQIAEKAHISDTDSRVRQVAFTLVPLPTGQEAMLPDAVTFSADTHLLGRRPASAWRQYIGRVRTALRAVATPEWAP